MKKLMNNVIDRRTLIGEILLAVLALFGVLKGLYLQVNIFITLLVILILLLICASIFYKRLSYKYTEVELNSSLLYAFGSLIISAFLVYIFHNYFETHFLLTVPVLGIFGALFFKKQENPIYLGAFIGMTSINIYLFIIIVVLAVILYFFIENAYSGYGGKLGSSAFFMGLVVSLFISGGDVVIYRKLSVLYIFGFSIIGAMLTAFIQRRFSLSTVLSSGIVGLLGSFLLLIPNLTDASLIATVILGSSFISMTVKENLNYFYIFISSLIFSFLYIYFPYYGIGGRLGYLAFLSVLASIGIKYLIHILILKYKFDIIN